MILLKDKWLFVSTMKCATNTLYDALQKQFEGTEWFAERQSVFHGIPEKRIAPIHWTVCRDPYDRAVSIWHSTCVRESNQDRYDAHGYIKSLGGDPLNFEDFVEFILSRKPRLNNPYLWLNQSEWHDLFICDLFLHIEDLESELREHLDLDLDLPHLNVSEGRGKWHEYYKNEDTMSKVALWAGDDFERYGYVM